MPNLKFKSGTSVKMDGTLPKIPFLKLQGRGAQITPRDHNITQNIHIKTFLIQNIFEILTAWIISQKKYITEFTTYSARM